jgi:hypothetical protein
MKTSASSSTFFCAEAALQSFEIYKVGMLQKSYADAGNFEIAQFFILQRFRTRITQQKGC